MIQFIALRIFANTQINEGTSSTLKKQNYSISCFLYNLWIHLDNVNHWVRILSAKNDPSWSKSLRISPRGHFYKFTFFTFKESIHLVMTLNKAFDIRQSWLMS